MCRHCPHKKKERRKVKEINSFAEPSSLERSIFFKKDHLSFIKEMIIKETMGRS